MDVFIPLGGPVNDFVYHRGFSHSLPLLAIVSPLLAWLIPSIHSDTKRYYRGWVLLSFLVLETSVFLDLLTIYGTQIFWPFDTTPMAVPVLFIIDPLFTLPFPSGVLAALVLKRNRWLGHRLNTIGLFLRLSYFAWSLSAGEFVNTGYRKSLLAKRCPIPSSYPPPAPFTTLLWRVVGIDKNRYFETYFSLFDEELPLIVDFYPRNLALMAGTEEHPPVVKLKRFTRGYCAFSTVSDYVAMTDLRMGSEPDYVFHFKVARLNDLHSQPIDDTRANPLGVTTQTARSFPRTVAMGESLIVELGTQISR